jgi:hypothetical protein
MEINRGEKSKNYARNWREKNREHLRKQQSEYRAANRERFRERQRQWRAENPGREKAVRDSQPHEVKQKYLEGRRELEKKYRHQDIEKTRKQDREYRKQNPEIIAKSRRRWRLKLYNLTMEAWEQMFEQQGRCCKICKGTETMRNAWHTDHCHVTGKVRGILCSRCNLMLGHAKDSVHILESAIAYLEGAKWPEP